MGGGLFLFIFVVRYFVCYLIIFGHCFVFFLITEAFFFAANSNDVLLLFENIGVRDCCEPVVLE